MLIMVCLAFALRAADVPSYVTAREIGVRPTVAPAL
jgi:hypothetical protein